MENEVYKICYSCKVSKPHNESYFGWRNGQHKQFSSLCRDCKSQKGKQHYEKNKDSILEKNKEYYKVNKGSILEKSRSRKTNNRETLLAHNRQWWKRTKLNKILNIQ